MKILNLIIYNESVTYEQQMKEIITDYVQTFENVQFFFICFREQTEDIMFENHCMYIKGKESFIPGILDKTIKAIEYCVKHMSFDYLIRSNISTIINFSLLPELTCGYATFNKLVTSYDPISGVYQPGIIFAQGTSIITSYHLSNYIIENKHKLDYTIIDDVSIALLLQHEELHVVGQLFDINSYIAYISYNQQIGLDNSINIPMTTAYRHKSVDRNNDVNTMKYIVSILKK